MASLRARATRSLMRYRVASAFAVVAGAVAVLGGGCYSTGDGPDPSTNGLYFPVGLVASPGGKYLYVANSDFDLQFNGGTVDLYDLEELRDSALHPFWARDEDKSPDYPCFGLGANPNPILYPGSCGPLDINHPPPRANSKGAIPLASAKVGAFATDLLLVCHPPDNERLPGSANCMKGGNADGRGARLFVPVRGDRSLTFFDVDDDRPNGSQSNLLECGQATNNGRCADRYRTGFDPGDNTRGLTLPPEPFGIAVSDRADAIVVTHQASGSGAVSLFTGKDEQNRTSVLGPHPRLEFVLGGLPGSATGITPLPIPDLITFKGRDATNYQAGFAIGYRLSAQVDVYRFFDDRFAAPERPFLQRSAAFALQVTPSGIDSRDIVIDDSPTSSRAVCESECRATHLDACVAGCSGLPNGDRETCEGSCAGAKELQDCALDCTGIPLNVFVSNRAPPALLVGEMRMPNATNASETLSFYDSVPLAAGASRVVLGRIHDRRDPPGKYRPRVFVVCFDARQIIIYDPVERRVDGQIRTGRGPHALVMDPRAPIAYVGHFTDSYIGLIDLDQSHADTFQTIVATIGTPVPPKGSK